ncbi:elongation of very long chain fatty acids protein 7-like [Amyelois transitella]|uniref:elongation of very long chain fatty acids protein 7-like n=1 Tax=Amyelois transitella TaxID=680683 RepID=UPI0029900816|nr:elongation of very long chain fatty acids protein 7-like [Amyelois transitella]
MAAIIKKAWEGYQILFDDFADPRTKHLPLIAKPFQGILLLGLYLMFVLKWGPNFMKNRPAYNLDKIIIVYNAFQVIACAYLFVNALFLAWLWDYKWICEPVDFTFNEKAIKITRFVYFYFLLKVIDLLDTVFFVLRKKINQVSFLHVYHHTGMVVLIWGAVTYFPGGHGTLVGVINTFVHVVMYSYYLITVWDPSLKGNLWWKKYITQLQILQFLWLVVHMGVIVFKTDCEYPRWTAAIFLPQNLFMLILFIDFYIKTYIRKPKEKKKLENDMARVETVDLPNGKPHQN